MREFPGGFNFEWVERERIKPWTIFFFPPMFPFGGLYGEWTAQAKGEV